MSRRCLIAVFAILSLSLLVAPAWADWTGGGPTGAAVRAVLVDPITPSTIYVGTVGSGVFKSTDSGVNWTPSDPTGPIGTRTIRSIVAGPAGTLYAGSDNAVDSTIGVFQSTNAGLTWTALSAQPDNRKVQVLAWDGTVLYAGTREESPVTGGVFKWNGTTWTLVNGTTTNILPTQSSRRVQAFALNLGTNPPVVYAGTQGDGVFKSIDRGVNWTRLDGVPSPNQGFHSDCLENPEILSLAFDPGASEETLYAGATGSIGTGACTPTPPHGQGAGLFRYLASSATWDRRMNGLEAVAPTWTLNAWAMVLNTAGTLTRIFIGTDKGVFTSADSAGSWDGIPQTTNPNGFIGLPIRALGIDTSGTFPNVTLYAGSGGRGMFKRAFPLGVVPWTLTNAGLTAIRAQAAAVGSRGGSKAVFAGLVGGGAVSSTDNGVSWQNTAETSLSVRSIATDPTAPSTIYAATGRGVIKSVNGGDSWASASNGLPTTTSQDPTDLTPPRTVRSITVDPTDPSTLYAAVGGIFRSVNGGTTWTSANGNLPAPVTSGDGTVSAVVIDFGAGANATWGNLYAATDGSGVYTSIDGGVTWTQIVSSSLASDLFVTALALDPLPPAALYAGTSSGKVHKKTIGPGGWAQFGTIPGQPVPAVPVTGLVVKLGQPSKIYAGLNGSGVYVAPANTGAWAAMNTGLLSLNVAGLGFDPEGFNGLNAGTLYAATLGGGTFAFDFDAGPTPPFVNITNPQPPTFTTGTSPVAISGTASNAFSVFWSTNRGHAGFASGTSAWSAASVPLEAGPNVITVTAVDGGDFSQGSAVIEVTLEQPEPVISATPSPLAFGTVAVGSTSALMNVTVQNTGTANLVLGTITRGGANPGEFKMAAVNDLCSGVTLAPAATCTVGLKFAPLAIGSRSATLLIPSNDPVTSVLSVTLTGTGGGAPVISAGPSPLAFGTVTVGGTSALMNVTVQNTGTANLVVGTITRGGANPGEFKKAAANDLCSGVTLAPAATCTVGLKFAPLATGPRGATLLIPSNDPVTSVFSVTLTGTGGTPTPVISAGPSPLAFGPVTVGSTSALMNVTVQNTGTANLVVGTITRGGANPGEFKKAAANDLCSGVTLAPTATCTVGLKFAPLAPPGARSATLLIPSNDPVTSVFSVTLTGTGQ